jgi:hypothetical protein
MGLGFSVILCVSSVVLRVTKKQELTQSGTEKHKVSQRNKTKETVYVQGRNRSIFLCHPAGQVCNQGVSGSDDQEHKHKIYHCVAY